MFRVPDEDWSDDKLAFYDEFLKTMPFDFPMDVSLDQIAKAYV